MTVRTGTGAVAMGVLDPAGRNQALMVDPHNPPLHADPIKVRLTAPFAQSCPPGWPAAPSATGAEVAKLHSVRVMPIGEVATFAACVANALIAANAAAKV